VDRTNDPCGRFGARAPAMPPPPVVPNVRFCACLGPRATTDPLGFDPKPKDLANLEAKGDFRLAAPEGKMASVAPRVAPPGGGGAAPESAMNNTDNNSGGNGGTLTGMAAVEQVFHFLDGPADVLSQCSKKPTS